MDEYGSNIIMMVLPYYINEYQNNNTTFIKNKKNCLLE